MSPRRHHTWASCTSCAVDKRNLHSSFLRDGNEGWSAFSKDVIDQLVREDCAARITNSGIVRANRLLLYAIVPRPERTAMDPAGWINEATDGSTSPAIPTPTTKDKSRSIVS